MEKWRERSGLIVLLIVLGAFLIGAQTVSQAVKEGTDVTLVAIYSGDPSEITWKMNGNKLVDMELNPRVDVVFYRLQDRVTISHTNGSLTIRKLTKEDSGVYIAEVVVNGLYQYTNITLTVLAVQERTVIIPTETRSTKTTKQPKTEQGSSGPSGGSGAAPRASVSVICICLGLVLYFNHKKCPKSQSIDGITFHPIKMTDKTQITWKKDGQPVNISGNKIIPGPNGDLTINNATSEDKGKSTIQCNKKLDQEFFLRL